MRNTRHNVAGFAALLWLVMLAGGYAADEGANDWTVYHGDPALRGMSSTPLPDKLSLKWKYKAGGAISAPPVIHGDLIVFATENGELTAVNRLGKKAWSVTVEKEPRPGVTNDAGRDAFSTPPLWVAGKVVIGTGNGIVRAFDGATGVLKWKRKVGDDLIGAPNRVSGKDGDKEDVIVMSRSDGILYRLRAESGEQVWASAPVSRCDASPSVGAGIAAFGACDSCLHIVGLDKGEATGQVKFEDRGPVAGGAAIDDGRAYFGTRDGSILCVDTRRAAVVWANRCASNEVFTTPAVTTNRVIAASSDGFVYCLFKFSGRGIWRISTPGNPSSPVIAGDKVVVCSDGTVAVLRLRDGSIAWADKAGDATTPPVVSGGEIIVGTGDGFLFLYGSKSTIQGKP